MNFQGFRPLFYFFRAVFLAKRKRKKLNKKGIRILNKKAIGYSNRYIYRGYGYDELRKVLKFEVNHLIIAISVMLGTLYVCMSVRMGTTFAYNLNNDKDSICMQSWLNRYFEPF